VGNGEELTGKQLDGRREKEREREREGGVGVREMGKV
jgi:hypothetical protein